MSFLDNMKSAYGLGGGGVSASPFFDPYEGQKGSQPVFGPSSSALGGSREAGPPDRLDLNQPFKVGDTDFGGVVQGAGAVLSAPGYIKERPIATLDTLIHKATGVSPVSGLEQTIGGVPVLGDVLGRFGDLFNGNAGAALVNSRDVQTLADHAGQHGQITIGYGRGGKSQPINVDLDQLRQDMAQRGFTDQDYEDVREGRKSAFDFGDHQTSSSGFEDLAARMLLDPSNLLLFTPLAELKLGSVASKVADITKLKGVVESSRFFENALTKGLSKVPLPAKEAAVQFVNGAAGTAGSLPGLTQFLKVATRSGKSLADLGVQGGKLFFGPKGQIATTAVPAAIDFLADHTDKGTPVGGFFENLRSVADDIENDRPLSENGLFNVYAATHFPLKTYAGPLVRGAKTLKTAAFGVGEVEDFARRLGLDRKSLYNLAGGRLQVSNLIDFIDEKIALSKLERHPLQTTYVKSFPEAIVRNAKTREQLAIEVARMRKNGEITMADRAQAFKDWYTAAGETDYHGVRQRWDPELALKNWTEYRDLAGHLAPQAEQMGVTIGLNDGTSGVASALTREDVDTALTYLKSVAKDGMVEPRDIQALLDEKPFHLVRDNDHYWERALIRDRKPISLKSLQAKLGKMREQLNSISEITAAFANHEAGAEAVGSLRPDLAQHGAAAMGNVLEAGAMGVSRMRPEIAKELGLPEAGATNLEGVDQALAHPAVQAAEVGVPKALSAAGFPIEMAVRKVGGWLEDGTPTMEPSIQGTFSAGASLADMELATALAAHTMDQNAGVLRIVGRDAMRAAGVKANGAVLTIDGIQDVERASQLALEHFGDTGFTLDRHTGTLEIFVDDAGLKDGINAANRLSRQLGAERPDRLRAYIDFIDRDRYAGIISDAVERGDPRVHAYDARAAELADQFGRSRVSFGPGDSGLVGALGLGGRELPRTPRDWGRIVPGEVTPDAASPAEQLRVATDSEALPGDYVAFARDRDISSRTLLQQTLDAQGTILPGQEAASQAANIAAGVEAGGTAASGGAVLEPWRDPKVNPYAANTELVPVRDLLPYREFDRRAQSASPAGTGARTAAEYESLKSDVARHGIREPLVLEVFPDGTASLIEGNHRLAVAEDLGLESVPVRVRNRQPVRRSASGMVSEETGTGEAGVPAPMKPDEYGYVRTDVRPSDVGLPTAAAAGPQRPYNPVQLFKDLQEHFGLEPQAAQDVVDVVDARAQAWSAATGRPAAEWYSSHVAGLTSGDLAPGDLGGTLHQGSLDVRDLESGRGAPAPRTREALEPMLEQPAPKALLEAGEGTASPLEWVKLEDGSDAAIPGGTDGEFSLWDAWRLKSQQIDPNLLPRETRVKLYAKLFRSQARDLSNPVDAWNRIAFAQISPQLALLKNEAGLAAIRASSVDDIRRIAEMPLEDLLAQVKDAGAASVPLKQQLKTLQANAQRFVQDPEWFNLRPGEDTIQYAERVMSALDGAGMKVGNFSTMLGDPLSHNRGTIDSHMVELLTREGLLPPDVAARLNGEAPKAKLVPLEVRGQPNPEVPDYLRDLPFRRADGKVVVFDGDYKVASEALDAHLHAEYPDLPFRSGGGQWLLWDMERHVVEPHTTIWPGSDQLPKMSPAEIRSAQGVAKDAGYFRANPEHRTPYDPAQALFYQGDRGATTFLGDGRALIRGLSSPDVSTALHEFAHVFRRDLSGETLAAAEKDLGVENGVWERHHEETFAQQFESWVQGGKAPTPALEGAFKRFATWLKQIYAKVKGSPLAQKVSPEMTRVFESLFNYTPELADVAHGAKPLEGLHPGVVREFERGAITQPELARVNELEVYLRKNYPRYRQEPAPQIASFVKPTSPQGAALREYNLLGSWLFDRGPLSPVVNFSRWLLDAKPNLTLHQEARQALYSEVISRGGTSKSAKKWIQAMQREVENQTFGPAQHRVRLFRDYTSLPANTINRLAREAGVEQSVIDAVGADRLHTLVDRASSRYYRNLSEKKLAGGKAGTIASGLRAMYDGFQNGAGIHYLYDAERHTAKVYYHLFRFILDPRWWTYNLLEADTINAARYGMGATRAGKAVDRVGEEAAVVHSGQAIKKGAGLKDQGPGHYSGWNDNRAIASYITKAFDSERAASTGEALRELGRNHPVIRALRDRFGEDEETWVQGLDNMMYDFDTIGVKNTINRVAKELEAQGVLSVKEMKPFIAKLYERNQQLYDDIVRNLHGNGNRTNLERMLNSYWLYWPISYQLKAGKWLFDTLTHRMFGRETNLGGLYKYEQLRQAHQQEMANDPEYAALFNDHPEMWFAAQMLLPITPEDLGVSLSRPVRYLGSALKDATGGDQGPLGFLASYKAAKDPVTAFTAVADIGPIYTLEQLQNIWKELHKNSSHGAVYAPPGG